MSIQPCTQPNCYSCLRDKLNNLNSLYGNVLAENQIQRIQLAELATKVTELTQELTALKNSASVSSNYEISRQLNEHIALLQRERDKNRDLQNENKHLKAKRQRSMEQSLPNKRRKTEEGPSSSSSSSAFQSRSSSMAERLDAIRGDDLDINDSWVHTPPQSPPQFATMPSNGIVRPLPLRHQISDTDPRLQSPQIPK